jgi:hypothetical protein
MHVRPHSDGENRSARSAPHARRRTLLALEHPRLELGLPGHVAACAFSSATKLRIQRRGRLWPAAAIVLRRWQSGTHTGRTSVVDCGRPAHARRLVGRVYEAANIWAGWTVPRRDEHVRRPRGERSGRPDGHSAVGTHKDLACRMSERRADPVPDGCSRAKATTLASTVVRSYARGAAHMVRLRRPRRFAVAMGAFDDLGPPIKTVHLRTGRNRRVRRCTATRIWPIDTVHRPSRLAQCCVRPVAALLQSCQESHTRCGETGDAFTAAECPPAAGPHPWSSAW